MTYDITRGNQTVVRLSTRNEHVVEAPDTFRWALGKHIKSVLDWCAKQGLSWVVTA